MDHLLQIDDLEMSFSDMGCTDSKKTNLFVPDLSVFSTEIVFIVGKSGLGKTTFLRSVVGLHRTIRGRIIMSPTVIQLGLLPQQPQLVPWRSVRRNLELPFEINNELGYPGDLRQRLERLGLTDCEQKLPHQLSVGMRTRVAFLQVLYTRPQFICLDEPSASLDDRNTTLMMAELRMYLDATGAAAVVASHDRGLVEEWSSRTYRVDGDGLFNRVGLDIT
jgi:ABC-type nitrate/sulfonate/bicarbonate transport system ATPase subunit